MDNSNSNTLIRHLDSVKAVLFDGDGTLWRGSVSKGIGINYLMRAAIRLDVDAFKSLVAGARSISKNISDNKDPECLAKSLEELYHILVDNNLGAKEEMMAFSSAYLSKHMIPDMKYLLNALSHDRPLFLITISGSTSAAAARKVLPLTDSASNQDIFDSSGRLLGVNLTIKNGEDKLVKASSLLEKYGLRLRECAAFGDGAVDLPMLKAVKISVASKYASDLIKGETDFVMAD